MTKLFAILPAVVLLAACNGDQSPEAQASADAMAEGEVLGGTISDEMLPLDMVKSQSPPLKAARGPYLPRDCLRPIEGPACGRAT